MNKIEITWSAFIWNLGESGSTGRVDGAVANPEPDMLLASSHPHDHLSIKVIV